MSSLWPSAWSSDMRARTIVAVLLVAAAAATSACGAASANAPAARTPAASSASTVTAPAAPALARLPGGVAAPAPPRPAFDHKAHVARGPACIDCHADAETKDSAGMPTAEACMECHEEIEEKAPPEKRIASFLDPVTKKPRWSYVTKQSDEVRFSHVAHAKEKVACIDCHRGISESQAVSPALAQTMDDCTQCHAAKGASNACATCHSVIGTETPPPNHDRLWEVRHGQIFRRGAPADRTEDCSMCHTQSSCVKCHADEKPKDHTTYWLAGPGHGLAASMDRERCSACHTSDTCTECHTTNAPRNHRGAWGSPRNRHCIGCHVRPGDASEGGCAVCHKGTPSHREAPPKPADHRPDSQCLLCHDRLRHPVNDQNCNECHR